MRTGTWWIAACAALVGYGAALGTGAWADDDDHDEDEVLIELEDVEDVLEAVEALSRDLVKPAKAIELARAKGEGVPVEVSLGGETREGKLVAVWEVELLDGETLTEWYVDARDGTVFAGEKESVGEHGVRLTEIAKGTSVSMADAAATVADTFAGAVVGVELEIEGGVVGWEAAIVHDGRPGEVLVDGRTGKVLLDVDDDDEEEDEEVGGDRGEHEHDDH
jgi:uncharacterized membrane protein YkoI